MKSSFFERNVPRPMPKFSREEIGLGKLLGTGGFCRVHEVVTISLPVAEDENDNAGEELSTNGKGVGGCEDEKNEDGTVNVSDIDSEDESVKSMTEFDEVQARTYMQKHCMREDYVGEMNARYAIKRLKSTLKGDSVSRGTDDLAVEAKFLAAIEHPNIIKMRAVANVKPTDPGFFILLDRLFETLEERIDGEWTNVNKVFGKKVQKGHGCCCMSGKPMNVEMRNLWVERLIAAYDLSSAFRYIHKNRIVYRDIKPENIGFDVRGDVKLFDFGFAREMLPKDRVVGTNCYNLTALTGSMRYMAPEVALKKPYNEKADVYSFGILLYEIVALAPSFDIENIVSVKIPLNET